MKPMIKGLWPLSTQIQLKVNSGISPNTSGNGQLCTACLAPNARDGLCRGCRDSLPYNRWHCRRCALPLAFRDDTQLCGECQRQPPPFSRVVTPWRYQFPVDRMIHRYKYQGQRAFGLPLIRDFSLCIAHDLHQSPENRPDLLVPSPMHRARRRKRGFNQADDITEQLSRALAIPWSASMLTRTRKTRPQSGLSRDERLANLRGIVRVTTAPPAKVAIIDDVITTGATARVLAEALTAAGALDVQVWALARTPG